MPSLLLYAMTTQTNPGIMQKAVNTQWQGLLQFSWRPAATVDIWCQLERELDHQFSSLCFAVFNSTHDLAMLYNIREKLIECPLYGRHWDFKNSLSPTWTLIHLLKILH